MTLEECYTAMGGNYSEILQRLGKVERIEKYLIQFLKEPSFSRLCKAIEDGNGEEAFREAHSLKGICLNLGLQPLLGSAATLSELLRGGQLTDEARAGFEQVKIDYETVQGYIKRSVRA